MKKIPYKKFLFCIFILILLGFMFLYPIPALNASKLGVLLWFETLLPSLLPFMILSNLVMELNIIPYLTFFLVPIFRKLFHLSSYGCYALIIGFLCGYPMGAKTTADLVSQKKLTKAEGQYLLSFCNNVSPMFIITFLVTANIKRMELLMPTVVILYASPLLCACVYQLFYRKRLRPVLANAPLHQKKVSQHPINFEVVDTCIYNGFESITKLGGYVILFSILGELIRTLPISSEYLRCLLIGSTEITGGIQHITASSMAFELKYIFLLAITSFGGLSSIAQTQSMIKRSGLSIKNYIGAKIVNMFITIILCIIFIV